MLNGLKAADCVHALQERFRAPEWAFFEQVANGTGYATKERRWADAIAIGLYPSRGLLLHGFEIKVSRSDWKVELANPQKSDPIKRYCDHWWLVAPRGLVEPGELPAGWGLVEVNEKFLPRTKVVAPKLAAKPLDKQFMAAVFRRHSDIWEPVVAREIATALGERERFDRIDAMKKHERQLAARILHTEERYSRLQRRVEEYREHFREEIAEVEATRKVG